MASRNLTTLLFNAMFKAVATLERKTNQALEDELSTLIGVSSATLERMRAGAIPLSDPRSVSLLAEVAVQRGLFGEHWLQKFLESAKYPHPEQLMHKLFGHQHMHNQILEAEAPNPVPLYSNLGPAPSSSLFVPRREPLADLLHGFEQGQLVVLLGMGGMGKSSLAYYVATLCCNQRLNTAPPPTKLPGRLPHVHAVVWISDATQSGHVNQEQVIDIIARTLDHPGLSTEPLREKQAKVEQLLSTIPTLLILDNAETIRDPLLFRWLLSLLPHSAILITTRQITEAYQHDRVCIVKLAGMSPPEARRLIRDLAKSLKLEPPDAKKQQTLIERSGASPQAIKQLLGYTKRTHQSLDAVLEQFDALTGDLLANLFGHLWTTVLSEEARRLLIALSCVHYPVARNTLNAITAFVPSVLNAAITQLSDTALVDVTESPADQGTPRFVLHPLTRSFVGRHHDDYASIVQNAQEGLMFWAADYAATFGYKLNDVGMLARLEADEATLMQALVMAAEQRFHDEAMQIAKGIEFFYYIKCRWDDKLTLHSYYIEAAQARGKVGEQINALTMHIQLLCRLNRPEAARTVLEQLALLESEAIGEERFHVRHAHALYHHTCRESKQAIAHWYAIVEQAEAWGLPEHMPIGALHWLGLSRAQSSDLTMAQEILEKSLLRARKAGIKRWVARNQLQLALLALKPDQNKQAHQSQTNLEPDQIKQARKRLDECNDLIDASDREQHAHLRRAEAYLLLAQRQRHEAKQAYREAHDLFARMGLLHELASDEEVFRDV